MLVSNFLCFIFGNLINYQRKHADIDFLLWLSHTYLLYPPLVELKYFLKYNMLK